MQTKEYLYGEGVSVPDIPKEVVDTRVALLRANLERLLEHSFHTRDTRRCTEIFGAISFWEKLNDS